MTEAEQQVGSAMEAKGKLGGYPEGRTRKRCRDVNGSEVFFAKDEVLAQARERPEITTRKRTQRATKNIEVGRQRATRRIDLSPKD